MFGAYLDTENFAYPGWRLTIPGGPAGGHYKGFTHNYSAGTGMDPQDEYELERAAGYSGHDAVHASPRNPRGVYRSSGEVPPRPNASGSAMVYRGFQSKRHSGTSVSPGSFPAQFVITDEEPPTLQGLAMVMMPPGRAPVAIGPAPPQRSVYRPPAGMMPPGGPVPGGVYQSPVYSISTGATSVVTQPAPTPVPVAPSPTIPVATAPPVSPTPAPIVGTNEVVPLQNGSYLNLSTGTVVPASSVTQNPATGQLVASSAVASDPVSQLESWLQQPSSFFPSVSNWMLVAGGLAAVLLLKGKHR